VPQLGASSLLLQRQLSTLPQRPATVLLLLMLRLLSLIPLHPKMLLLLVLISAWRLCPTHWLLSL
jgi:hypothetical protein